MTLPPEELKRLADKVLPVAPGSPYRWAIDNAGFVSLLNRDNEPPLANVKYRWFRPSLTGEDWQQAQALQCIVAAWKRCSECRLYSLSTGGVVRGFVVPPREITDILTAACLSLIRSG